MQRTKAASNDDLFADFEAAAQPQDNMQARAAQMRNANAARNQRGGTAAQGQSRPATGASGKGRAMATNLPSANQSSDAMARRQQALRAQQMAVQAQQEAAAQQAYQQEMQQRADIIENGTAKQRRQLRRQDRAQAKAAGMKGPGVVERVQDFFTDHPPADAYDAVITWLRTHSFIAIVIGVAFIAIGLLFNRYVSFGGAVALLAIGWLVGRSDEYYDPYIFYIAALFTFVVPYLF